MYDSLPTEKAPSNQSELIRGARTTTAGRYRPDIDGLRALAVTAVVLYHLDDSWLPGGFVGVDIFFVISGYVVTGSILDDQVRDPISREKAVSFYLRRIKRLAPAHLIVTCTTGLLMAISLPPSTEHLNRMYMSGMLALVGCSANLFATLRASYFDEGVGTLKFNPFTHTWSLGVEEQFYLVFPFFIFFAYCYGRSQPEMGFAEWICPKIVLCLGLACSACVSGVLSVAAPQLAFFTLPSRFWELMAGALLFEFQASSVHLRSTLSEQGWINVLLQLFAVALLSTALVVTRDQPFFPFPWALLSVSGSVAFIIAGLAPTSLLNWCFSGRVPVYVGRISYPIYLWHWPLIVMSRNVIGLNSVSKQLICVGVVVGLAAATYHFVESRFRSWQPKQKWYIFFFFMMALVTSESWLAALAGPLRGKLYLLSVSTTTPLAAHPSVRIPSVTKAPSFSQAHPSLRTPPVTNAHSSSQVNLSTLSGNSGRSGSASTPGKSRSSGRASSSIRARSSPTAYPYCQCQIVEPTIHVPEYARPYNKSSALPSCFKAQGVAAGPTFSIMTDPCFKVQESVVLSQMASRCLVDDLEGNTKNTMFVFGDSHSAMLMPGLKAWLGWRFTIRLFSIAGTYCWCGYKPLSVIEYFFGHNTDSCTPERLSECKKYVPLITSHLASLLREGDAVVVSHMEVEMTDLPSLAGVYDHEDIRFQKLLPDMMSNFRSLYDVVSAHGATLILFGQTITKSHYAGTCTPTLLNPQAAQTCEYSKTAWLNITRPYDIALAELKSSLPDLIVLDSESLVTPLCDEHQKCGSFIPGTQVRAVMDDYHLSDDGSRYLGAFWCAYLAKHGLFQNPSADDPSDSIVADTSPIGGSATYR